MGGNKKSIRKNQQFTRLNKNGIIGGVFLLPQQPYLLPMQWTRDYNQQYHWQDPREENPRHILVKIQDNMGE
jgi:hypothetical protein